MRASSASSAFIKPPFSPAYRQLRNAHSHRTSDVYDGCGRSLASHYIDVALLLRSGFWLTHDQWLASLGDAEHQRNRCEKDAQAYRHHPSGSESWVVELTVLRL
jgi:hypothetical protein